MSRLRLEYRSRGKFLGYTLILNILNAYKKF